MNGNASHSTATELRNISATLHEMKDEAARFVRTRVLLLKSELQEKLPHLKVAAVLAVTGSVLLLTTWLLLSSALVAVAAILFRDSEYRWVFAFLSVGVLYAIFGGILLYLARREFAARSLVPERTIDILKGDKIWIQGEASQV